MARSRIAGFVTALACALVACHGPTEPAPTGEMNLFVSGAWATACCIPSGSYTEFSLHASEGRITGAGHEHRLCCWDDSLTISGEYWQHGWTGFTLAIQYAKGPTATYVGQVFGVDSLVGTWTSSDPPGSGRAAFYRQAVPPCADSAPLLGTYDPRAPGYIIVFRDSVDAQAESAQLAARYGFTTTFVWQYALKGFFTADISIATVAVLRCEPSVASVSHDGIVTAQASGMR